MSRILYLLLLIAAAIFYPLYEDELSYILLLAVMILPLLLGVQLIVSVLLLRCSSHKNEIVTGRGGEGEIQIDLFNRSVFPLSGVRVMAKVVYSPTGGEERVYADIPLPARSFRTVTVNISQENCGEADVYLEYVRVTDLLRLFSVKLFKDTGLCGRVYVVPGISEKYAPAAAELMKRRFDCGSEEEGGDSGSFGDIAGYRQYRPGDRLSRINHKLSARFDKDMVRIMSASQSGCFLLTADLTASPDRDGDITEGLRQRDSRFEKLMSLSHYLSEEGGEVYIAVPDSALPGSVEINGVPAMKLGGDNIPIATALAGAEFFGALPGNGNTGEYTTIRIDRTEDNDEKEQ